MTFSMRVVFPEFFRPTKHRTGGRKPSPLISPPPDRYGYPSVPISLANRFPAGLYLHKIHLRIVERHAPAHRVEHAGVLEVRIHPHGGVGVDAGPPPRVALAGFPVDHDVRRPGRPVPSPHGELDHPGPDRFGRLY